MDNNTIENKIKIKTLMKQCKICLIQNYLIILVYWTVLIFAIIVSMLCNFSCFIYCVFAMTILNMSYMNTKRIIHHNYKFLIKELYEAKADMSALSMFPPISISAEKDYDEDNNDE